MYTYDARGRITGIQDGNQNQTGYHMDPWGRVHQIETAEGGKENFTYDYAGHVTSTRMPTAASLPTGITARVRSARS